MKQHKGKIVEKAIKKSGYQMKALAEKLKIARNTLYGKLKEIELEDALIMRIGGIIHYDFTIDFPHLCDNRDTRVEEEAPSYTSMDYKHPSFIQLQELNRKYLQLLEGYNKLLKILIMLANNNELTGIKKEIEAFLTKEEKEDPLKEDLL
ncbi:helix-turn-helix domain-containing protein [Candidatus Cardinium hertigii]|uniref:DNA binding HTH domain-containing protein n=1 Tax=Candidatus Cardinium hertigii TaxID=247481 RepID=A0A2Z3LDC4_9BACT|nr:helix-turn-helix domain-containing protein [Candidatus Cardinium hertigii]AWN81796.1 hypothetical protein DK880_00472 [Candidatus Cardinium hertigii]